jgi:hypothetical protein
MHKITNISILEAFKICCIFNNGEKKVLDLFKVLDDSNKYKSKVLNDAVFHLAKIGSFGEIYWDNIGEIKNYDGSILTCEYDISPEFAYFNSTKIN